MWQNQNFSAGADDEQINSSAHCCFQIIFLLRLNRLLLLKWQDDHKKTSMTLSQHVNMTVLFLLLNWWRDRLNTAAGCRLNCSDKHASKITAKRKQKQSVDFSWNIWCYCLISELFCTKVWLLKMYFWEDPTGCRFSTPTDEQEVISENTCWAQIRWNPAHNHTEVSKYSQHLILQKLDLSRWRWWSQNSEACVSKSSLGGN